MTEQEQLEAVRIRRERYLLTLLRPALDGYFKKEEKISAKSVDKGKNSVYCVPNINESKGS